MSLYTPPNDSLNDVMRLIRWDDFQYIVQSIKDIAAEVRKDNRRKQREFSTSLMITPIKGILAPISKMFNHRCSDDSLFYLISQAVRKISTLVRKLQEYREPNYVKRLEEISSILVSFIGEHQGIQLEIFDSEKYFYPNGAKRKLPCFIRWYKDLHRSYIRPERDGSMKIGFTKPFINCGNIPFTQLTIPFGRANIEAAKKRYMAAYFDVTPYVSESEEVSPAPKEDESSGIEDIGKLGLRTLRQVARFMGLAQKVDGKDRSKADFVEALEKLLHSDREKVIEALAAVGWVFVGISRVGIFPLTGK